MPALNAISPCMNVPPHAECAVRQLFIKTRRCWRHLAMSTKEPLPSSISNPFGLVLGLTLVLMAAIWLGIAHVSVQPVELNSTQSEFSVVRAKPILDAIAAQPHPVGTPENARVRDYLSGQLRALGLQVEIQEGIGLSTKAIGRVHNIVARLPGSSKGEKSAGKALLLMAHYDTAPNSPGAADNGASVAAILETLRAVRHGPPLANDLIVLLTDGEETGLLGAHLFAYQHPWRNQIGMLLNFEYRGNRGAFWMYETSYGNGKLIDGLQQAVPQMHANSLLYEVYKFMPNSTDFTQFKRLGVPGLNFAAIDGHNAYHTQLDTPANLDLASWQDEGRIMLAVTRYFGGQDLRQLHGRNHIYFDLPGLGLVSYASNWPATVATSGLLMLCLFLAQRQQRIKLAKTLLACCALLLSVILLAGSSFLLWQAVLYWQPEYRLQVHGSLYNQHWYLAAFVAFAVALFASLTRLWQKFFSVEQLLASASLLWGGLLLLSSLKLEGVAWMFTWPLLPFLLVWLALLCKPVSSGMQTTLWVLASCPAIVIITPLMHLIFIALTPSLAAAGIVMLALLLCLMTPVFNLLRINLGLSTPRAVLPCLAWPAMLLCLVAGGLTGDYSAQQPRPAHLAYLYDGAQGYWYARASHTTQLDARQTSVLGSAAQFGKLSPLSGNSNSSSGSNGPLWFSKAPGTLPLPSMHILSDRIVSQRRGKVRVIEMQVASARVAPMLRLELLGGKVYAVQLQGNLISQNLHNPWSIHCYGLTAEGIHVVIEMEVGSMLQVRLLDRSYHLPELAVPARTSSSIAPAFSDSDTSNAFQSFDL